MVTGILAAALRWGGRENRDFEKIRHKESFCLPQNAVRGGQNRLERR